MISRFGLLTRAEGTTPEEFDRHWQASHGPLAAKFPGLLAYYQHTVVDREQFGISHARGGWDLDGFSELHFDDIPAMLEMVASPEFSGALADEDGFLGDCRLVACEKHVVVPLGMSFFTFKLVHYALERSQGMIQKHGFDQFLQRPVMCGIVIAHQADSSPSRR